MHLLKNLKLLFALLISASCSSLQVPDVPLCVELNPSTGYCVNTVTAKEFKVDDTHTWEGKSWWEIRPYMIYLPADSWEKLKLFIITVCTKTKQCDSDISGWKRVVDKIDENITKKRWQ